MKRISALGFAVLAAISCFVSPPEAGGLGRQPASAAEDDASARSLIAGDCSKAGDAGLDKEYQKINARHFGGRLPRIPVLWEGRLQDIPEAKGVSMEGLWGHYGDNVCILLNPRLQRKRGATLEGTLSHEMVHEYLYTLGDTTTRHGPAFQKELQRLWKEGAFAGLPATEADKKALHAWLNDKERKLGYLEKELERQRRDLQELNSEVADYNRRMQAANARQSGWPSHSEQVWLQNRQRNSVGAFNTLLGDYNGGVEQYNHLVKRYNLMLIYPLADGLDENTLVQPRAPAAGEPTH